MYEDGNVSFRDTDAEKVYIANVYDPVKYMLKNLHRRTMSDIDEKIDKASAERNEGATLHRNGHFLEKVEGDTYRDFFLYYTEKGVLDYFVVAHKITGRIESWSLHFHNNILVRYDYELINEGEEEELDSEDALWPGWGESIDSFL